MLAARRDVDGHLAVDALDDERGAERRLRDLSDRPSVCVGVYRPGLAGNPVILQPSDTTRHSLTAEELAILQGFPAHPWQGNTSSQYRQIGNAVPPVLAEVLGRAVLAAEGPP
ncbi:MAG: DNA cytosine methyltransferase [Phycisphaerales bacterium]